MYGNAGAHGSDMSANLVLAEILHRKGEKVERTAGQMKYGYRTSLLKQTPGEAVILSARLKLAQSTPAEVQARMNGLRNTAARTAARCKPGSMFKNPAGDYAGRLIEAAGLKGTRIGGVQVSPVHANFFINDENATARDIDRLLRLVQQTVFEKILDHQAGNGDRGNRRMACKIGDEEYHGASH